MAGTRLERGPGALPHVEAGLDDDRQAAVAADEGALQAALEDVRMPALVTGPSGQVRCVNAILAHLLAGWSRPGPTAIHLSAPVGSTGRLPRAEWVTLEQGEGEALRCLTLAVRLDACLTMHLVLETERVWRSAKVWPVRRPQADDPRSRLDSLSARETEVLRALLDGSTNKQAARRLGISPRTVELHRSRALAKLGVQNMVQALALSVAGGLDLRETFPSPAPGSSVDAGPATPAPQRCSPPEASDTPN